MSLSDRSEAAPRSRLTYLECSYCGARQPADRLATRPEPLMRGDRVHFTSAGADWIGGVLAGDLMAAYDAWQAERGGAE